MPDKSYAFIERMCPLCHGTGEHPAIDYDVCPICHGTGLMGNLEESQDIRIHLTQFSKSLRATRERHKVSLRTLAMHIGVSPSRLSGLESGLGTPTSEEEKTIREWMEVKNEPYN